MFFLDRVAELLSLRSGSPARIRSKPIHGQSRRIEQNLFFCLTRSELNEFDAYGRLYLYYEYIAAATWLRIPGAGW